jgi:hypothetical protein
MKSKSSVFLPSILISTFYIPPVCLSSWFGLSVNREALEKGEAGDGYLPLFERHAPWKACRLPHPCQELNPSFTVFTFMLPCIVIDFFFNNQPDALIIRIYSVIKLHVSAIFSAHHQDFSTVHSALVSFMQVFDDRFQAESGNEVCVLTSRYPTLQHHKSYNRAETHKQCNAVWPPDDGRKDSRNMLKNNWLPINHYLLHLVGLAFIY